MSGTESNQVQGGLAIAPEFIDADETNKATPKLNTLNFMNLIFYIINSAVTYGLLATSNRKNISQKYQTLVTPIGWSFVIWLLIFVFQGIWAILQLFPKFRAHPYVQKGVSYWYLGVCTAQSIWSFVYTYGQFWASLVFISLIALSLAGCVIGSYYQYSAANKTLVEFWFLLFPFSIHFGWILCVILVNVNIVVVWFKALAVTQITVAICSLAVIYVCSVWALFVPTRPSYTVPAAIIWEVLCVYFQLAEPVNLISETFDSTTISSIRYSAGVICLLVVLLILIRLFVGLYNSCTSKNVERDANEVSSFVMNERII